MGAGSNNVVRSQGSGNQESITVNSAEKQPWLYRIEYSVERPAAARMLWIKTAKEQLLLTKSEKNRLGLGVSIKLKQRLLITALFLPSGKNYVRVTNANSHCKCAICTLMRGRKLGSKTRCWLWSTFESPRSFPVFEGRLNLLPEARPIQALLGSHLIISKISSKRRHSNNMCISVEWKKSILELSYIIWSEKGNRPNQTWNEIRSSYTGQLSHG